MPAKMASPASSARGARNGRILEVVGDVQIDAAVLVFAVLGLQIGDKLAERLALVGHDVGQQQRIEQAVALGQMALEADAAGLLAAHDDLALQHEVARQT